MRFAERQLRTPNDILGDKIKIVGCFESGKNRIAAKEFTLYHATNMACLKIARTEISTKIHNFVINFMLLYLLFRI